VFKPNILVMIDMMTLAPLSYHDAALHAQRGARLQKRRDFEARAALRNFAHTMHT